MDLKPDQLEPPFRKSGGSLCSSGLRLSFTYLPDGRDGSEKAGGWRHSNHTHLCMLPMLRSRAVTADHPLAAYGASGMRLTPETPCSGTRNNTDFRPDDYAYRIYL